MHKRLRLHPERQFRLHNSGQQLLRALRQALSPAELLYLETVNFHRQFGGAIQIRQVHKLPALDLRPITEIGILSERIVLPPARIVDHRLPQNSGSAVEIEEIACA